MSRTDKERIAAFISIPKNASNTVRKILQLGENRDIENTDSLVVFENHQRGCLLQQRYDIESLYTFCFSRNPYDRCVSWYEFCRDFPPYDALAFSEWVQLGLPHHFKVQNLTDYAHEGVTPLLQTTYTDGCKVDFVGKLECFDQDMKSVVVRLNEICENRGIQKRFNFTPMVANAREGVKNIASYYSEETAERVYQILRQDFEVFGYSKRLPC